MSQFHLRIGCDLSMYLKLQNTYLLHRLDGLDSPAVPGLDSKAVPGLESPMVEKLLILK